MTWQKPTKYQRKWWICARCSAYPVVAIDVDDLGSARCAKHAPPGFRPKRPRTSKPTWHAISTRSRDLRQTMRTRGETIFRMVDYIAELQLRVERIERKP
jgi:hypothetical protein